MTLNTIKVKNFQSIESGEVRLGKFTVFTGPSSSGKSAFLRAAKAVIRNDFNPSQVRLGAKEATVTVDVDGVEISAIRGKSKSTYKMDEDEYTKAGRTVPEPISKVLGCEPIADIDSTFASQFDKPYLIAEPGAVAAKVLGTLTNVNVLHNGIKEANRRKLDTNSTIKVKVSDLERVEEDLEQFSSLDSHLNNLQKLGTEVEGVVSLQTSLEDLETSLGDILSLSEELKEAEAKSVDLDPLISSHEKLTESTETLEDLDLWVQSTGKLLENLPSWNFEGVPDSSAGDEVEEDLRKLTELDSLLSNIVKLNSSLPRWDYSAVEELEIPEADSVVALSKLLDQITSQSGSYKAAMLEEKNTHIRISELQGEYDTLLEDFPECPLCGTSISH